MVNQAFTPPIPEKIRKMWGDEIAADFVSWLAAFLQDNAQIILDSSPHVQVTAAYARRKVNRLMLDRVSYLLLAGEPSLIHTDRWYWRVPVDLTFPSHGRVGRVGEIDLDATSGEIRFSDELLASIAQHAEQITQQTRDSANP